MNLSDPLPLAQTLIRCASVTPADAGAQEVLGDALAALGFEITRLRFGDTENLFARLGAGGPHFCFAGHTDVVPAGDGAWAHGAFAGEIADGVLYGRGACDMKGAVAAFVAAVARFGPPAGTISLLITGDEEGPAIEGTVRVVEWMRERGIVPDFCLVGEPTNAARLGETIKIGRRGSLNAAIAVFGTQGHVAYPQRADNPVHRLVRILGGLIAEPLDFGSEWFEPSSLQITSVDVGNATSNLIPAAARARVNIRFNDLHTGAGLAAWLRERVAAEAERFACDVAISGESFLTAPGEMVTRVAEAVAEMTGVTPALDTGGGTSDARFIAKLCPVAEFGLVGASMHKTDECVAVAELETLTQVYRRVLEGFFGG